MEKILYVTDAVSLHMPSLDFACYLGKLTHSRVLGIFLENLEQETRTIDIIREKSGLPHTPNASIREIKEASCKENLQRFREACETRGANCAVHRDRGTPIGELVDESRYADLIVTDAATSFSAYRETVPSGFVKDVLQQAECPVIIAPERFEGIDEIIFAFDNSRSAAFAIKQFTYLFPQLYDRKAVILSVTTPGKHTTAEKYKLREWLKAHYDQIDMTTLEDNNINARLLEYLLSRKNVFIVMGAFGRSMLSYFFKPSHADKVVKLATHPIFITHH